MTVRAGRFHDFIVGQEGTLRHGRSIVREPVDPDSEDGSQRDNEQKSKKDVMCQEQSFLRNNRHANDDHSHQEIAE